MKLYVNGQDIHRLVLGNVDTQEIRVNETEPEGYLQALNQYVKDWQSVEAIYAVVGPGSATALRSILSIVQTVSFVQGTSLYALEKPVDEADDTTLGRASQDGKSVESLVPIYQHSPRITVSHKDALGRA